MDLRQYLKILEEAGELLKIAEEVSLRYEVGAVCRRVADGYGPALLFQNPGGLGHSLVVNLFGSRRRIALALGVEEGELGALYRQRLRQPLPPVRAGEAPCQEEVFLGEEVNLGRLPIPLWNPGDGGAYLTGGVVLVRHPEYGYNASIQRLMVAGPRQLATYIGGEHHLNLAVQDSPRVEAAIVLGGDPALSLVASSDFGLGEDERAMAGALRGKPLEMVPARSVDLEVPAEAEIIIEGYFDGSQVYEGPFVEFTGYQSGQGPNFAMQVTAITCRRSGILPGVFAGRPPCETNVLWRELEDTAALEQLQGKFPLLNDLHRPPEVGRDFMLFLQVNPRFNRPGMVQNLLLASAAVVPRAKFVVAVDDDIDIHSLDQVMWAVSTRVDPERDILLVPNTLTSPLDPGSREIALASKALINATRREDFRGKLVSFGPEETARAREILARAGWGLS